MGHGAALRSPLQHDAQHVVAIGEAMRLDLEGFAGGAFDRKAPCIHHRQHRVDNGPHAALVGHAAR